MQDIVIGNKIVSHVVKSKTTYYRSYNEFYNRLTVSYATPSGECHDLTIFCGASNDNASGDVLYFIMYIIILIAEIDDSETLRKLCVLLLDERHTLGIVDNIEIKEDEHGLCYKSCSSCNKKIDNTLEEDFGNYYSQL